jgi:ABC-type multidrug transport system permease subunit
MIRTALLVFRNEFRLLLRDRMSIFMLFMAPIVIITVAGFSLGNMFGAPAGARKYLIPVVDRDHGAIARAIVRGMSRDSRLRLVSAGDVAAARAILAENDDAPIAILIPAGTTAAFSAGREANVVVYVDPVKQVEAYALESRLAGLSRAIGMAARDRAQTRLERIQAEAGAKTENLSEQIRAATREIAEYQARAASARASLQKKLAAEIAAQLAQIDLQARTALSAALRARQAEIAAKIADKQTAMAAMVSYLEQLRASRRAFEHWLDRLKAAAGSHAGEIPSPPAWPPPPDPRIIAELNAPITLPSNPNDIVLPAPKVRIEMPSVEMPKFPPLALDLKQLAPAPTFALPGVIGWQNRSLTPGYAEVNSFDQYVPGFGITFLLIDILWGVSVGLIDERDWGTLQRLQVSGAPISGLLSGKLTARFLIGFVQMTVLLGVGRALFGISLGRSPAMLLLPTAAIAFSAAAFGLVIAVIAGSRDSVLPLGSVGAMTMSAVGGCWWPLNFEPAWMRMAAQWIPTTWTMRAYNDLMIRGLPPAHALKPTLITFGLGLAFLCLGMLGATRGLD